MLFSRFCNVMDAFICCGSFKIFFVRLTIFKAGACHESLFMKGSEKAQSVTYPRAHTSINIFCRDYGCDTGFVQL